MINLREDTYGGSPENRARFVVDVVTAVAAEIGAQRVGLRISPGHQFNGVGEVPGEDLTATYAALVSAVAPLDLAYLSILASPLHRPDQGPAGTLRGPGPAQRRLR